MMYTVNMTRSSLVLFSLALFACSSPTSTFTLTPDGGDAASDVEVDSPVITLPDASDDVAPPVPLGDVEAVVTCDNAYGFGWGDVNKLDTYNTAPASVTAGDIFNCGAGPEGYTIPAAQAPAAAYLYGIDFDSSQPSQKAGPTLQQINTEISTCNAGTGNKSTSSGGWVNPLGAVTAGAVGKLAIGQDNTKAYNPDFPIICQSGGPNPGVDSQARWMWYTASGNSAGAFKFTSLTESRPFLIFRLAAKSLPPPPN